MKDNKKLNPFNDPEIAELLKKSPDDQLWYFLDDCVPNEDKDVVLVMLNDFNKEAKNEEGFVNIQGVPYCSMVADLIFEKSEKELLSMPMTRPYEKYFAIQKACYKPYFTECYLLDNIDDFTKAQRDLLDELQAGSIWAVSLKKPGNDAAVKVAISFLGCNRDITKEGWLIRISDSNQG